MFIYWSIENFSILIVFGLVVWICLRIKLRWDYHKNKYLLL